MDINNNTQKAEFGDEKESNNCKDFELTASNQKNNDIELSFTDPTGNSQNELIIIIHTDNNSVEVIKKTPDPKPVATTGTTLTDIDLENIEFADDIKNTMNELLDNPIEFKENLEIFNDALGLGFVNSSNVLNNDFISTVRETVLEKVVEQAPDSDSWGLNDRVIYSYIIAKCNENNNAIKAIIDPLINQC